jgi:hypothetical protein
MKRILLLLALIAIQLIQGYKLLESINNKKVEEKSELSVKSDTIQSQSTTYSYYQEK